MFRSYDHLHVEMYIFPPEDGYKTETCSGYWIKYSRANLKVGCLHPVACTGSGSGFSSNTTLFWIFYSVTATYFGLMTIFKRKCIYLWPSSSGNVYIYDHLQAEIYTFPPEDGHETETCSGYWIKYSKQCCVKRKPWTWTRANFISAWLLRNCGNTSGLESW
jgi:hypothetical protein